jgi:hypothetical protein
MHGRLLLLLAVALALLLLRPTRERLEPTSTIKPPTVQTTESGTVRYTYDDTERERIISLIPGLLDRYQMFYLQTFPEAANLPAAELATTVKKSLVQTVADVYTGTYASATAPLTAEQLESHPALPEWATPPDRRVRVDLLKAYFLNQPAESTTGGPPPGSPAAAAAAAAAATAATAATGTSSSSTAGTGTAGTPNTADGSIKVPDMTAMSRGEMFYSDAEMNRIQTLSPTAYSQAVSFLVTDGQSASNAAITARIWLSGYVAEFYTNVYSTLTRPVQASDIDAFIPTISPPIRPPPEMRDAVKELLQKYYMGAAASQGPSYQPPKSFSELSTEYQLKLAQYQEKVSRALETNDATALPAIRALNQEIRGLLEQMLTSLDPLRQDTDVTRRQREELAMILGQIESDYTGLQDSKDSMTLLRRIRKSQAGPSTQDVKLYAAMFLAGCLAVFVIAMSRT